MPIKVYHGTGRAVLVPEPLSPAPVRLRDRVRGWWSASRWWVVGMATAPARAHALRVQVENLRKSSDDEFERMGNAFMDLNRRTNSGIEAAQDLAAEANALVVEEKTLTQRGYKQINDEIQSLTRICNDLISSNNNLYRELRALQVKVEARKPKAAAKKKRPKK